MLLDARPTLCEHANGGCVHGSRPGVSGAGLQMLLSWVVLLSPECPWWTHLSWRVEERDGLNHQSP